MKSAAQNELGASLPLSPRERVASESSRVRGSRAGGVLPSRAGVAIPARHTAFVGATPRVARRVGGGGRLSRARHGLAPTGTVR